MEIDLALDFLGSIKWWLKISIHEASVRFTISFLPISWSNVNIFYIIKFIKLQCVDTLINANYWWGTSAGANWISCWIGLELDIFMVLDDVLLNVVISCCLFEIIHTLVRRPEWTLWCIANLFHFLCGCRVFGFQVHLVIFLFWWWACTRSSTRSCLL